MRKLTLTFSPKTISRLLFSLPMLLILQILLLQLGCSDSGKTYIQPSKPITRISQMDKICWSEVAPGVWRGVIGNPEKIKLLDFAAREPQVSQISKLPAANPPFDLAEIVGATSAGKSFVRIPFDQKEQMFGLGFDFHRTHFQRGTHERKTAPSAHAPVPFFMTSKNYGVLLNTANRPKFCVTHHCLRADSKKLPKLTDRNFDGWIHNPRGYYIEAAVDAPGLEIFVFTGPSKMNVVQRFNLYCGGGVIPPKWGLGFWSRFHTRWTDKQINAELAKYKEKDMPISVAGIEPGWHSASYPSTFVWDKRRFANPKKFISKLDSQNIKVNLWQHACVHPQSPLYKPLYDLSGSHLEYQGIVPDFTFAKTRKIFQDYHQKHLLNNGVSGFKLDECDGGWPDHAVFPSGLNGEEYLTIHGLAYQKTITDLYKKNNLRTFGLVRASNAGSVGYPFVLYSDHYNHQHYITAMCTSSISGLLWTPEIRQAREPLEWARRMQSTCMSPLAMLNAWASGKKPWSYPAATDAVRKIIKLRNQMLPYFYSTFAQYRFAGKPPVRSLLLVDSTESNSEFMLGDNLLVAPMIWPKHKKSRKVYLPKGSNWYDFYTGKFVGKGGTTITASPAIDKMPLYVKDGGFILLKDKNSPAIIARYYGNKVGSFELYDDDGKTYNYEKGEYIKILIEARHAENGKMILTTKPIYQGMKSALPKIKFQSMTK